VGGDTRYITQEHEFEVSENRLFVKICLTNRCEGSVKFRIEDIRDFSISSRLIWAVHVDGMGETKNAYTVLARKRFGKWLLVKMKMR
jgi:hypothetical protein